MAIKGIEGPAVSKIALKHPAYKQMLQIGTNSAISSLYNQLGPLAEKDLGKAILDYGYNMGFGESKSEDVSKTRAVLEKSVIRPANQRAARVRDIYRSLQDPSWLTDPEMEKSLMKANLDVGTLTNFASVTGGQSLGYVSLDTRMARGTIRPNSFTLYQACDKSLAWQIVDFWALAKATGGAPPGAAFANYSSVSSGSLATNAGTYDLLNIVLKLALDGRAITTALAAQNNYVNVSEQENTNAALTVLETLDWAGYLGDATVFTNQFDGILSQIVNGGYTQNLFDYYQFYNSYAAARSWSPELTLYNMIYECAAQITSYANFGHITHAFMSPTAMGSFQGLTVTQLNNVLSQITELQDRAPLVVNGNLIGMQTRFGHIQFPMDLMIEARDIPVQAIVVDSVNQATATNPTKPVTVTAAAVSTAATVAGTNFNGSYIPGATSGYLYAVASCNASMLESTVTYTSGLTGIATGQAMNVTITHPVAADATSYRVFRSGLGGCVSNSAPTPGEFRFIGHILDSGSATTVFTDLNGGVNFTDNGGSGATVPYTASYTKIPGSSTIFLLDMDPIDLAIDYRMLLPLVRVELFANNLYMPWAVAAISALRLRVPKFHGAIRNYVPTNPAWNPLQVN
jgi:hypothetical protein